MEYDFGFRPSEQDYYYASFCTRDERTLARTAEICRAMHQSGIRLWYDDGSLPEPERSSECYTRISESRLVIMFISSAVLSSPEPEKGGVLNDYRIADGMGKKILPVFIGEIDGENVHEDYDRFYNTMCMRHGFFVPDHFTPSEAAEGIIYSLRGIDASLSALRAGVLYSFGRYPQCRGNTPEPVDWIVLDVVSKDGESGSRALLISRFGLDIKPFNREDAEFSWKDSTLRKWLNEDFINMAFSPEEQKRIKLMRLQSKVRHGSEQALETTEDRLFCLSVNEARRYFGSDLLRTMENTPYAMSHAEEEGSNWWWLRTPGLYSHSAAIVHNFGYISDPGMAVDSGDISVRPALWLGL